MRIVCPSCSASYTIKATPQEADGRKVRCAQCSHIWTLNLGTQKTPDPMPARKAQKGPKSDGAPDKAAEKNSGRAVMDGHAETTEDRISGRHAATQATGKARGQNRKPLRERLRLRVPLPLLAVVMLALLIGAGVALRHSIVHYVPDLAGLYEAIGMPVNSVGLSLVDVKLRQDEAQGAGLIIEGAVRNISESEKTVPPVSVLFLGDQNRELYAIPAAVDAPALQPGEQTNFRAEMTQTPEEATTVRVVFR
jgi:predicted Zn finger-like uncharacterized protein